MEAALSVKYEAQNGGLIVQSGNGRVQSGSQNGSDGVQSGNGRVQSGNGRVQSGSQNGSDGVQSSALITLEPDSDEDCAMVAAGLVKYVERAIVDDNFSLFDLLYLSLMPRVVTAIIDQFSIRSNIIELGKYQSDMVQADRTTDANNIFDLSSLVAAYRKYYYTCRFVTYYYESTTQHWEYPSINIQFSNTGFHRLIENAVVNQHIDVVCLWLDHVLESGPDPRFIFPFFKSMTVHVFHHYILEIMEWVNYQQSTEIAIEIMSRFQFENFDTAQPSGEFSNYQNIHIWHIMSQAIDNKHLGLIVYIINNYGAYSDKYISYVFRTQSDAISQLLFQ